MVMIAPSPFTSKFFIVLQALMLISRATGFSVHVRVGANPPFQSLSGPLLNGPLTLSSTALHVMSRRRGIRDRFVGLFGKENTFERRQKIREQIERDEDEDFLLADIKPKALSHERDYFRQETRIEAWDEYVLVSILCTSISYTALTNFQLNPDHENIFIYESVLKTAIEFLGGLAVLSGLYSTMVYSLSILYCKQALGEELDAQYDEFLDRTEEIRDTAFIAFSSSLACFATVVVLVLSEELPLVMHFPAGSVMIGALFLGFRDWKTLVDCAKDIDDNIYLDDE